MMLKHEITEDELLNDFCEYIKLHPKTVLQNNIYIDQMIPQTELKDFSVHLKT